MENAKHIGGIWALAVALGIGMAVASTPAVACGRARRFRRGFVVGGRSSRVRARFRPSSSDAGRQRRLSRSATNDRAFQGRIGVRLATRRAIRRQAGGRRTPTQPAGFTGEAIWHIYRDRQPSRAPHPPWSTRPAPKPPRATAVWTSPAPKRHRMSATPVRPADATPVSSPRRPATARPRRARAHAQRRHSPTARPPRRRRRLRLSHCWPSRAATASRGISSAPTTRRSAG